MKVISVQRVRDLALSAVGVRDYCCRATEALWHDSLAGRRINSPVPVSKTNLVSYLHSFLPRFTRRILVRYIHSTIMQDLLEQRKVWSMPSSEQVAHMGTVAHHMRGVPACYLVPFSKRETMNTCGTSDELQTTEAWQLTSDLEV